MTRALPARVLPWIAIAVVAAFGLDAMLAVGATAGNGDILSYQRGVEMITAGTSPYAAHQLAGSYRLGTVSWGHGFVYPPTSILVLWPTALGAIGAWKAVNAIALLVVVGLIAWRGTRRPMVVGAAVALTTIHPGMHVREGQVEPLIAAAIGALWLVPSAWLAVGGGLVKLHPLVGLVWVARKGGSLLVPLLSGMAVVATWAIVAPELWRDWLTATLNLRADCNSLGWFSVTCATGTRWAGPLLGAVLLLGTWRIPSDSVAFLLMTIAILVAVPDTYPSYWLIPWVGVLPLLLTTPVLHRRALARSVPCTGLPANSRISIKR